VTIGLLPEQLREQYDFSFTERDERFLNRISNASRKIHPYLPGLVRYSPKYRKAQRHMR